MTTNNILSIPDTLARLAATASSTEKKKILQETKSPVLASVFNYTYNHFITFGVHKIDAAVMPAQLLPVTWYTDCFRLLEQLSTRRITGNNAKRQIIELMERAPEAHAMVLFNIIKKDLRIGCGVRVINSVYEGLLPEATCMAAMKYDSKRVAFPVYADTKLDGVRCVATLHKESAILLSRNAKEFNNYGTIASELAQLRLKSGTQLDGEITCGHFQNLMRTVSRKSEGIELAKDAVYNIFDIIDKDMDFELRQEELVTLQALIEIKNLSHLKIVAGTMIQDEQQLLSFYQSQLDAGQEGIIVKSLDGMYEFKRSYAWQKMKPELTDDLIIIGIDEGEGKYADKLGAVVCRLKNGGEVHVGSGFTDIEREELWNRQSELTGRMIEVKYQEKTQDGSLRFPVFMRFRPDKE